MHMLDFIKCTLTSYVMNEKFKPDTGYLFYPTRDLSWRQHIPGPTFHKIWSNRTHCSAQFCPQQVVLWQIIWVHTFCWITIGDSSFTISKATTRAKTFPRRSAPGGLESTIQCSHLNGFCLSPIYAWELTHLEMLRLYLVVLQYHNSAVSLGIQSQKFLHPSISIR